MAALIKLILLMYSSGSAQLNLKTTLEPWALGAWRPALIEGGGGRVAVVFVGSSGADKLGLALRM